MDQTSWLIWQLVVVFPRCLLLPVRSHGRGVWWQWCLCARCCRVAGPLLVSTLNSKDSGLRGLMICSEPIPWSVELVRVMGQPIRGRHCRQSCCYFQVSSFRCSLELGFILPVSGCSLDLSSTERLKMAQSQLPMAHEAEDLGDCFG